MASVRQLYRVEGRVQGVAFRASCRNEAQRLGLTGYARNMPDGSVQVLVCGDRGAVDAMEVWLWRGPSLARVRSVIALDPPPESDPGRVGFRVE